MNPKTTLALPASLHTVIWEHLFPGDGMEAAAILICARTPGSRTKLLAHDYILIPYEKCSREADSLTWPGSYIEDAIDKAQKENASIILIHSHPGGLFDFSQADDLSDRDTIPALQNGIDTVHGSAIMTPNGAILARFYDSRMRSNLLDLVTVAGDNIQYWWSARPEHEVSKRPIAFTGEMTAELGQLTACVIGVSGTGSLVAEQVARLGFGKVILIDFDIVERKNLNRIINATENDADSGRLKVELFVKAITSYRGVGVAHAVPLNITKREAVIAASESDVVFSCVDTLAARHIADLICASCLIPLFDVGVVIPTRNTKDGFAIADVYGRTDYVFPGGSTLGDRGVYNPNSLAEEYLRNASPTSYQDQLNVGYMKGVLEEAPAVITLNMQAASKCVMEFIARAYPFRHDENERYARHLFSLATCESEYLAESTFNKCGNPVLGKGAQEPLLGLPMLALPRQGVKT